jgi:hypothetical protein
MDWGSNDAIVGRGGNDAGDVVRTNSATTIRQTLVSL